MRHHQKQRNLSLLLSFFLAAGLLPGCAVKQPAAERPAVAQEADLRLAYRMPDDRSLRYRVTTEHTHSMDLMGQQRRSAIFKTLEVSVKSDGSTEDGHDLSVTIDSLIVGLDTPRGEVKRQVTELVGKSFDLVLSPHGEVSGFSRIAEVSYDMPPLGAQNVQIDFERFFPHLVDRSLADGERWATTHRLTDTAFNSGKKIVLEGVHTLTGFETIDGRKCAKINSFMNGMLEEGVERMTRAPEMTGRFDGNATWFFAIEEGLLVKSSTTLRGSGVMSTGGGHGPPSQMSAQITIDTVMLP